MRYQLGELELDTTVGRVTRAGEPLEVPGLTLSFFTALVEASPEPLDTDELAQRVWQRSHVSDETVRKRASLLRAVIGADIVRTLPNRRYGLSVPVREISVLADDQSKPVVNAGAARPETLRWGAPIRAPLRVLGTVIGVGVVIAGLWVFLRSDPAPRLVNPETGDVLVAPRD